MNKKNLWSNVGVCSLLMAFSANAIAEDCVRDRSFSAGISEEDIVSNEYGKEKISPSKLLSFGNVCRWANGNEVEIDISFTNDENAALSDEVSATIDPYIRLQLGTYNFEAAVLEKSISNNSIGGFAKIFDGETVIQADERSKSELSNNNIALIRVSNPVLDNLDVSISLYARGNRDDKLYSGMSGLLSSELSDGTKVAIEMVSDKYDNDVSSSIIRGFVSKTGNILSFEWSMAAEYNSIKNQNGVLGSHQNSVNVFGAIEKQEIVDNIDGYAAFGVSSNSVTEASIEAGAYYDLGSLLNFDKSSKFNFGLGGAQTYIEEKGQYTGVKTSLNYKHDF